MCNGLSIGKKTKDKTLVLDMDETMIAAAFEGRISEGFKETFAFNF
jgi:predicted secreted acid phosphatase